MSGTHDLIHIKYYYVMLVLQSQMVKPEIEDMNQHYLTDMVL